MIEIFLSILLVSLISLIGFVTVYFKNLDLKGKLYYMISFAAGTMLAASFFDIIPEALNGLGNAATNYILLGIMLFLFIEKYIHWHHCNTEHCEERHKRIKPYVFLNLLGDGLHNFIDGAVIAAAYRTNFQLGLLTTLSVAAHELPQEIGDFSILLKGGLKFKQALAFNFLIALTAFLGGVSAMILGGYLEAVNPILLCIAAGGFIYLSLADIIPETHKEVEPRKIFRQAMLIVLGMMIIYVLIMLIPE